TRQRALLHLFGERMLRGGDGFLMHVERLDSPCDHGRHREGRDERPARRTSDKPISLTKRILYISFRERRESESRWDDPSMLPSRALPRLRQGLREYDQRPMPKVDAVRCIANPLQRARRKQALEGKPRSPLTKRDRRSSSADWNQRNPSWIRHLARQ